MRTFNSLAVAAFCAALGGTAAAHDDAYLDTQKAPNGGQLRQAGPYHLELVIDRSARASAESPLRVFVTDHAGQAVSSTGLKGNATLLGSGARASIVLSPDGENRLKGVGKYAAEPAMKVVVAVTFADGKTEQARFEPLKISATDNHDDHKH